jgi:hypothetical protein
MPTTESHHVDNSIEFAKALSRANREHGERVDSVVKFFDDAQGKEEEAEAAAAVADLFSKSLSELLCAVGKAHNDLIMVPDLAALGLAGMGEVAGEPR